MIVGFMGTGKTTVGRLAAQRLGRAFVDLDARIVATAGRSIPEIFQDVGEPGFRQMELSALRAALDEPDTVVATGGGAACRQPNLDLMLEKGRVVALFAPVEEILARTGRGSGRPMLDDDEDPAHAARRLMAEREPYYRRAHLKIDTHNKPPELVVDEMCAALATKEKES